MNRMLDTGKTLDDLVPTFRLEGEIYVGDPGYAIHDEKSMTPGTHCRYYFRKIPQGWPQTSPGRRASGRARKSRVNESSRKTLSPVGMTSCNPNRKGYN